MRNNVKNEKNANRRNYESPMLVEVGSFRANTGYLGIRNRESLINYPRNIW